MYGDFLRLRPDVILMHQALAPGSRTLACYVGVTLLAPRMSVASRA